MQSLTNKTDLVRAVHPYSCKDQSQGLAFPQGVVLLIAERSDDGWCRGYAAGNQGWFPATYVQSLPMEKIIKYSIDLNHLAVILKSSQWTVYATQEERIYFVNNTTKETSWTLPPIANGNSMNGNDRVNEMDQQPKRRLPKEKAKRSKQLTVNGLTFMEGGELQDLLDPRAPSYIDYFWRDADDQTGFDVIKEKHINGKFALKEMAEFIKERAAIEEQYAKNLAKLAKSTLGDNEEGTLLKAWLGLKTEIRERSEAHSKLASKLISEIEKPLLEFKESQKVTRKEHEQIIEKARKQVQTLDISLEKAKLGFTKTKDNRGILRRFSTIPQQSSVSDVKSGEDMMKLEGSYNQAQRTWMDDMINACRDFEKHEEERSDFLQEKFLNYIDACVVMQESIAEVLTRSTIIVDNINKKADREYFIKRKATGTQRPVDRYVEI